MINGKLPISIGLVLFLLVPIWLIPIHEEFEKMDSNFYHYEEQIGINSLVSEYGDNLPEPFIHHNIHKIQTIQVNDDILELESHLTATNEGTNFQFLDEIRTFQVDMNTRSHQSIEKGLFMFPPHVEKRDYLITSPLAFTTAIFSFEQETQIHGLDVYEFHCISDPYDITNAIPHFEDYVVKSLYSCKIWIEPLTGEHVNFELSWESYYEEDKKFTLLAEQGNKRTTPEFVKILVEKVQNKKTLAALIDYYFPTMFTIVGVVSFLVGYRNNTLINKKLQKEIQFKNQELIKSERLSAIGELGSRLAHDLRNPLAIIQTSLENIKIIYGESDIQVKQFDKIQHAIFRMTHQIDDVLDFVRTDNLTLNNAKMSDVIANALDSLYIPNNLTLKLPKNDVTINCDSEKISVVFINLILNAIQSIDGKGTIKITVEENKNKILIKVQDSGKGISKEDINKIFEPLFTTKMKGTGLGLSSAKSIIELHRGTISVTSPPTIFTITIPKVHD